jgi:hypothetical protein
MSSVVTFLFNGFPGMAPAVYCKKAIVSVVLDVVVAVVLDVVVLSVVVVFVLK